MVARRVVPVLLHLGRSTVDQVESAEIVE